MEARKENNYNKYFVYLIYFLIFQYPLSSFGFRREITLILFMLFFFLSVLYYRIKITYSNIKAFYLYIGIFFVLVSVFYPYEKIFINLNEYIQSYVIPIYFMFYSLYLLITNTKEKDIVSSLKKIYIFGLILSLYILLCKIWPYGYEHFICPFLIGLDKNKVFGLMKAGYGVQVGGSPEYADYMITIASFVGFYYLYNSNCFKDKIKIVFSQFLLFMGILTEGRRSELVCYLLSIIVVSFFIQKIRLKSLFIYIRRFVFFILISGLIISVMNGLGFLPRLGSTFIRIENNVDANEISTGRLVLWQIAIEKFIESPIVGNGWNSFRYFNPRMFNAHNTYIQFLCEIGLLGFISVVTLFISLYIKSFLLLRKSLRYRFDSNNSSLCCCIVSFGMQTYLYLLNFFDPCFYKGLFCILLVLSVILLDYSNKKLTNNKNLFLEID